MLSLSHSREINGLSMTMAPLAQARMAALSLSQSMRMSGEMAQEESSSS